MTDKEFMSFFVSASKLFPHLSSLDKDEVDMWKGWLRKYSPGVCRAAVVEHKRTCEKQFILFSDLEREIVRFLERSKRPTMLAKSETIAEWIRRTNGGDGGNQPRYGADWSNEQVIMDHYGRAWNAVSNADDQETRDYGRSAIYGYAKMALVQSGKTTAEAEGIARDIVGVSPGEKIRNSVPSGELVLSFRKE